jgi:GDPmannose 4,6-dehydratase
VDHCIREHRPALVFHLAAHSTTRHEALFESHSAISTGTINILEAVYRSNPATKVFITGSAVQFHNDGKPISETAPFEASSPYSLSRIHSVYAARYYRSLGVKTYVGYLFHHESPQRKPNHMSQKIILAAKRIKAGSNETLEIGDLSVEKEWTFAGDVAGAMLKLVSQDAVHEAVIGSGEAHSIQEWVECCFSQLGLDWRKHVRQISGFEPEFRRLVSDPRTIFSLDWRPVVGFSRLAAMMIQDPGGDDLG